MIIKILINLLFLLFVNFFCKKIFLVDKYYNSKHKINTVLKIPLSGGIFFYFTFLMTSFHLNLDIDNFIFYLLIILIGIGSDLNKLNSPKVRFLLQFFTVLFFVIFSNITLIETRISFLDFLLDNKIFNIFFVVISIVLVINGSNFIDGLNGFLVFQVLQCLISIIIISEYLNISLVNVELFYYNLAPLLFFYFFNLFNKNFLGDSVSYFLGFYISVNIILFVNANFNQVSPFFAVFLLWYISFEVLFTIIRRINRKKNYYTADKQHLHTLFYLYLKNKYNKNYINSVASIILSIVYIPGFFLATLNHDSSVILSLIILFNVIIYITFYSFLNNQINIRKVIK